MLSSGNVSCGLLCSENENQPRTGSRLNPFFAHQPDFQTGENVDSPVGPVDFSIANVGIADVQVSRTFGWTRKGHQKELQIWGRGRESRC